MQLLYIGSSYLIRVACIYMRVTQFSYSLKLLYKLMSHCDGSVNIQDYIFVSAVFLSSVYLRQFSLGLPINSYVPLFLLVDSYFSLTAM